MAEKKKMLVTFYQIAPHQIGDDNFNDVVNRIKRLINGQSEKYTEQTLAQDNFGQFNIRVFYAAKTSVPKWRPFISDIVTQDSAIGKCYNTSQSFLLFVGYKDRIFAITGGAGSFAIDGYISQTFGIDVITRLIDKTSPVIKSFQNRGVTGTLLGQTKHFRTDRRLADENQFGQIYKEVKADLNKKILTTVFGFKASDLKRDVSGCLAKTSFQISKSMDFNSFLKVIANLNTLLDKPINFSINSVEMISRKKSILLIGRLEEALLNTLYNSCLSDEESDFDFTHREFDKYLRAAYYRILEGGNSLLEFTSSPTLTEIQKRLKNKGKLLMDDAYQYKHSLLNLHVDSMDDDGNISTHGTVMSHLHGEIFYEGHSYFFIDGEWYRVGPNFIAELNNELKLLLDEHWDESLINESFDLKEDEGIYNARFIDTPGVLVLDTITPENIESCDLLKYDANSIYLIHVKKGFNNMVRDLAAQVLIAAKRIQQDRKSGFEYIKELQDMTLNGKNSKSDLKRKLAGQTFPEGGLLQLFDSRKNKQICFCLAFVDTAEKSRNLKNDLTSFRSNIAKYALLELMKEINALGFDFRVIQLKKIG